MKSKNVVFFLILLSFVACKTQEDIRREKAMDNINEKITQTQQISAGASSRYQALEEQVAKLSGSLEEMAHNKGNSEKEVLLLKEKVNQLEETNTKQTEYIKQLAEKVNEQTKYIEQVVKSLDDLSNSKKIGGNLDRDNEKKKHEKDNKESEELSIKTALNLYKSERLNEARDMILDLLENKKLKKKDKGASLYYLGLIEYRQKKFEDAKVYFSRLFTEMPDSSFSPGALLNLSKTFAQLKSNEEAKLTLDELINRYPKSKEATEAQKLKSKL